MRCAKFCLKLVDVDLQNASVVPNYVKKTYWCHLGTEPMDFQIVSGGVHKFDKKIVDVNGDRNPHISGM